MNRQARGVFEYKTRYAPIWDLMLPAEKRQVLIERAAHFMALRDARRFISEGLYGVTSPEELEIEAVDDDGIIVEAFDTRALPVPLPPNRAINANAVSVYNFLVGHPNSTLREIADATQVRDKTVSWIVKKLRLDQVCRISGTKHQGKPVCLYEIIRVVPEADCFQELDM